MTPRLLLEPTIAAVEAEGARLQAEFYLPQGPRGRRASAAIDSEIELRLRAALQAICPCRFAGEESGASPAPSPLPSGSARGESSPSHLLDDWLWLVDPHDGTYEFLQGRRGSAISVALLRAKEPVLAVVHSPLSPDRGRDTIAWAEGAAAILRNGEPVKVDLSRRALSPDELVFAPASSAFRPQAWSQAVSPARYVAMPSIAYRLARVAAGDGAATLTIHPVNEYDIAAGCALIRAAGGTLLDAAGNPISLQGDAEARVSGCLAGAHAAVRRLLAFDWKTLEREARRPVRIETPFPRRRDEPRLSRAQGAMLGLLIGDRVDSRAALAPEKEVALVLARSIARTNGYAAARAEPAFPARGALLRAVPIAIWASPDPDLAARTALGDVGKAGASTCREALAVYAAAMACGVAGAIPSRMLQAALDRVRPGLVRTALRRAAAGERPADVELHRGSTIAALQNAFYQLLHAPGFGQAIEDTVRTGGESDLNASIAGALYAAASGKEGIPPHSILNVLAYRPAGASADLASRPMDGWTDDVLDLAEALIDTRGLGSPPREDEIREGPDSPPHAPPKGQ